MLTIPQEHIDKMLALGYRPVGAKWYHPVKQTIIMNGAFNQADYSAAKDAWLEDAALNVTRFPWLTHVDDDGNVLGVSLTNGWLLELTHIPIDFFGDNG